MKTHADLRQNFTKNKQTCVPSSCKIHTCCFRFRVVFRFSLREEGGNQNKGKNKRKCIVTPNYLDLVHNVCSIKPAKTFANQKSFLTTAK